MKIKSKSYRNIKLFLLLLVVFTFGRKYYAQEGPYFHQIYAATSSDGVNWTYIDDLLFDHASVPGAVFYNEKVYLYFVNAENPQNEKLSVGISEDFGFTFTVHDVVITGNFSPNPVDPNPIIDNGQIRLTYLGNLSEVESFDIVTATSSDGINFIEDGIIFTAFVFDPDLFYDPHNTEWVLFLNAGNLIKATAGTPTSAFTYDPTFIWEHGSISSTHQIGMDYLTYYVGLQGVSVAEYIGGELFQVAEGILNYPGLNADPTVVILGENNYKMFFKTESGDDPLPVELSSFTAFYNNIPTLRWTTQSESNSIGWNIYRSETENMEGSFRINSEIIPGAGTTFLSTDYTFIDEDGVEINHFYWYWLENLDETGQTNNFGPIKLLIPEDEQNPEIPDNENIKICNYPNPFHSQTTINFETTNLHEKARIEIYNIKGEKIKTFPNFQNSESAIQQVIWDGLDKNGNDVSTGIYFSRIKAGNYSKLHKMIKLD
ncbi:MAG: T9SS type A sorting domain-containing protein [Candidatus Cloacimonetes bacterium]|nr:T9SS type A sorting domain-containing protein [Candidatus Cloacimonadota bacterium]